MGKGIDYSGPGATCNRDPVNGVRYGIIGRNAEGLTEWLDESFEPNYGPATCGKCGAEMTDYDDEKHGEYERYSERGACDDYACESCELGYDSDSSFRDEPIRHDMTESGYEGFMDNDGDIWVTKSPYYTHAAFCSPCAPGACHLESPHPEGEKAYCLGRDWFQDEKAPYPIYEVATGKLVFTPDDELPTEPDDEDHITSDYRHWYSFGGPGRKLPIETDPEGDWPAQIVAHHQKTGFFPNLWYQGERGDWTLIILDQLPDGTVKQRE